MSSAWPPEGDDREAAGHVTSDFPGHGISQSNLTGSASCTAGLGEGALYASEVVVVVSEIQLGAVGGPNPGQLHAVMADALRRLNAHAPPDLAAWTPRQLQVRALKPGAAACARRIVPPSLVPGDRRLVTHSCLVPCARRLVPPSHTAPSCPRFGTCAMGNSIRCRHAMYDSCVMACVIDSCVMACVILRRGVCDLCHCMGDHVLACVMIMACVIMACVFCA